MIVSSGTSLLSFLIGMSRRSQPLVRFDLISIPLRRERDSLIAAFHSLVRTNRAHHLDG